MALQTTLEVFEPPHLLTSPLDNYLSKGIGDELALLCSSFPKAWSIYMMGGVLRDLLLQEFKGIKVSNADVDLVVNGADSSSELCDKLRHYCLRQNDFGGAKCQVSPSGVIFDVWRIEDHVGMSSAPEPHTIEQLLRHNLLNVDAALIDLQTGYLYDFGCIAAIHQAKIALVGQAGISRRFAAAQAAHIILIAFKTGFALSIEALEFVREACDNAQGVSDVMRIVLRKKPRTASQVEAFLNDLLEEEPWPTMAT
jgi:hypothetical protein